MLEYYVSQTAVTVELLILSGGITVTGRTPYVEIRNKDTGFYFDFNSNTFTGTTTSSTAPLSSAIEGLYRITWDVSGLFITSAFLMFEFHDGTAMAIDDVVFRTPPITTGDAGGGGGGITEIKGIWTAKQKKKLFDTLDDIQKDISEFRQESVLLLRKILDKKTLQKEDLEFITQIKQRDLTMFQGFLKILDLDESATEKDFFEVLQEYIRSAEEGKESSIKKMEEMKYKLDVLLEDREKFIDKLDTFLEKKEEPKKEIDDKVDDLVDEDEEDE